MRTDRVPVVAVAAGSGPVLAIVLAVLLVVRPVQAQEAREAELDPQPLVLVDRDTRVRSVDFRFLNGSAIPDDRLDDNTAYDGPGALASVRRALAVLPLISPPTLEPFSPLTLQRDVARLRQLYRDEGYTEVSIDYEVDLDPESNEVDITYIIAQGEPTRLASVDVRLVVLESMPDSLIPETPVIDEGPPPADLPDELEDAWDDHLRDVAERARRPYGVQEAASLREMSTNWLAQRGYPWARASIAAADTTGRSVRVSLHVSPGPRARVDSVEFRGQDQLRDGVLRREMPFEVGDWYNSAAVAEGERELYELEMIRRALGDLVPDQPADSTVSIVYRVEESRPRLVWGRAGWGSEGGVTAEGNWSHRNFFGEARTFTASITAETGWLALEQSRARLIGLSVLVRRPYLWDRRISGTLGPFARYRDDYRDRSFMYGVESSLIYLRRALHSVTLQHELSRSRVDDAYTLLPVADAVAEADSAFAPVFVRSVFKLRGAYGRLDDRIAPTSGFLIEPSFEITGPDALSEVDFTRVGISALGAFALSDRYNVLVKGSAGRLFPRGDSDPLTAESSSRAIAGLRGVMFTAGGTADVRGWGPGLAGPKSPEIRIADDGSVEVERYIPVGGLSRLTGSVEVGLPFPLLSAPHASFVFMDAGRVWSQEPGFEPGDPELAVDSWLYSVGAGLQFSTIAGPVRLAVGYKLNPTVADLLDPADVAAALLNGTALSTLDPDAGNRWHIHLAIGRGL